MSFLRYPEYKDSGVEWLGEVPAHWVTCGLGHRLSQQPCYGVLVPDFEIDGVPMLRILDIDRGIVARDSLTTISETLSAQYERTIIEANDVVLSVVGTIGECFVVGEQLAGVNLSRALARIVPGVAVTAHWLRWIFNSPNFERYVDLVCVGSAQRVLNMDDLRAFRIPCPEPDEQSAIAAFLDRETGKIDALVAEQEKLIALLKEKRQAVISHAVTKGLNPDAPLKPSGIEWLGDVPAHWEVRRIKQLSVSIEQGWSPQCESFPAEGDEWAVLKVGCVNGGRFERVENKVLPPDLEPIPELALKAGDLLISRANTRELVGSAASVPKDEPRLLLCDKLYRLRFAERSVVPEFVAHWLATPGARGQIELDATGASASMVNIGQSTIMEFPIACPPYEEQRSIVQSVRDERLRLDAMTVAAGDAITLLKERRSALISAAVTGQIDVRESAQSVAPEQRAVLSHV